MSNDNRLAWKCFECKAKAPKGDNSNTPVRSATHAPFEESNITMARGSKMNAGINNSILDETLPYDGICASIRKEFEVAIDGCFADLISKLLKTIVTEPLKKEISKLSSKINLLEDKFKALESEKMAPHLSVATRLRATETIARSPPAKKQTQTFKKPKISPAVLSPCDASAAGVDNNNITISLSDTMVKTVNNIQPGTMTDLPKVTAPGALRVE